MMHCLWDEATFAFKILVIVQIFLPVDGLLGRGGSLLFLVLASRTGNLRKLPVCKRTYLPQFLGGNLKQKTRVAKGKKITGSGLEGGSRFTRICNLHEPEATFIEIKYWTILCKNV